MSIHDLITGLRRRWYLLIVGLIATAGLAVGAYVAVPATYEAKASALLLPPRSSIGARGNPYLYLGGLNQALDVLSARMNGSDAMRPIAEDHPDVTVEIGRDATTSGPILVISAAGPDAGESLALTRQILAQVPVTMTALQNDLQVTDASKITVMQLNVDSQAEMSDKNKLRAAIAVGGAGLLGTIIFTGLVDAQIVQRRVRRDGERARLKKRLTEGGEILAPARAATETVAPNPTTFPTFDDVLADRDHGRQPVGSGRPS